ncbi:Endonuclease/exonuclease/phosphatase [Earliella scabrosa]|nr:Endonuclease/exonuclease/phosphatase [Earliella scabrosa]
MGVSGSLSSAALQDSTNKTGISALKRDVAGLAAVVDHLIKESAARASSVNTSLKTLTELAEGIKDRLDASPPPATSAQGAMDEVNGTVSRVAADLEAHEQATNHELATMQERSDGLSDDIRGLTRDVQTMSGRIDGLLRQMGAAGATHTLPVVPTGPALAQEPPPAPVIPPALPPPAFGASVQHFGPALAATHVAPAPPGQVAGPKRRADNRAQAPRFPKRFRASGPIQQPLPAPLAPPVFGGAPAGAVVRFGRLRWTGHDIETFTQEVHTVAQVVWAAEYATLGDQNRYSLQVLSWNVFGRLALQCSTPWFQRFVTQWDVLLLQETHLRPLQEEQLVLPPGYNCVARSRPESAQMAHQGGGLAAIFKQSLNVSDVTPDDEGELMILRVGDVTLVNVYLPPPGSPWTPDPRVTAEQYLLERLFPECSTEGHRYMLIGDFNARMGERCGSIPRTSPDKVVSTRGRRVLEMCDDLSFELLNGSALHKHESRDRFTSFQALGNTVIDLCLASASLRARGRVLSFAVLERVVPWSDHAPLAVVIQVELQVATPPSSGAASKWSPFNWSKSKSCLDEKMESFLRDYVSPSGRLVGVYGQVSAVSNPVQVYVAAAVPQDDRAGPAASAVFYGHGHPLNAAHHVPGPPSRERALIYALVVALRQVHPSTTLRVLTAEDSLPHAVCHSAVHNARSHWRVSDGDLLRALADLLTARLAAVQIESSARSVAGPNESLRACMAMAEHLVTNPLLATMCDLSRCPVPADWPRVPAAAGLLPRDTMQKVWTSLKRPSPAVGAGTQVAVRGTPRIVEHSAER